MTNPLCSSQAKGAAVTSEGASQYTNAPGGRPSTKLGTDNSPEDPGRILSDHQTKDSHLFNGHTGQGIREPFAPPVLSFQSRERKCPVCEQVFLKLTQHEFVAHVAGCFK